MSEHLDLDQMQIAYKAAVEEWIAAIKQEEALASVTHTVAEVDKWEGANFKEDELRSKVKAAKKRYEDALREKFFGFSRAARFGRIWGLFLDYGPGVSVDGADERATPCGLRRRTGASHLCFAPSIVPMRSPAQR